MGWHVRYIDRSLKHELLSPEFASIPPPRAAFPNRFIWPILI
jgi:hypothetical protein